MKRNRKEIANKSQNVLLTAYNSTPKGECNLKLFLIAQKCEVDERTVRRWIKEGKAPKKWMFLEMFEIFNNITLADKEATIIQYYSKS